MNWEELNRKFQHQLDGIYDIQEAENLFLLTFEHLLGLRKIDYLQQKSNKPNDQLITDFLKVLAELKRHKPIQYILGIADFFGLKFQVNESVLIPRPETEELVDWILTEVDGTKELSVLDIGAGSGCIAITLQKNLPLAKVTALDVSAESLKVVAHNADLNEVQLIIVQADILQDNYKINQKFDLIVSNPPYICQTEEATMHPNVLTQEPHLALFVPDDDPLLFYRAIANFALLHLDEQGLVFFEINELYGAETKRMLQQKGFQLVELHKDMQGKDRMIKAQFRLVDEIE